MMANPPPPPDRPTEPLRPTRPAPAPQPAYEERVAVDSADPSLALMRLEDAIASLRTALMVVGVLAVAALGVAIYALVGEDDDSRRGSRAGLASDARVSNLDDRVDRLSRQVQELRSGADGDVEQRIEALESSVKTLADRPDASQAIDDLSDRIDDLARDVEELRSAQPAP